MLFSISSFALFPTLRRQLQVRARSFHASSSTLRTFVQSVPPVIGLVLTAGLLSLAITLTAPLSTTVAWVYSAVFAFVTFAAPGCLIWAQKFMKYSTLRFLHARRCSDICSVTYL